MTTVEHDELSNLREREHSSAFDALTRRLEAGHLTVGIVGMGYVGLPLGLACADAGFSVVGFDINADRVSAINHADQVISYIPQTRMQGVIDSGRLEATDDFTRLPETDVIVICVPTPINRNREPDLSYVVRTVETIRQRLRPAQLVILESTTWPGTTREIVTPTLERSGLRAGHDFFVAFSPEREDPGNEQFVTTNIPKIVGADDVRSNRLAASFYSAVVDRIVEVSDSATAEATKLTENIFRSVNIALVNELKTVYREMGIDVWEVIDAAATKPFGFLPFYPGPGLGGHCIPIDPFYLTWKAREYGMETRFIELAGQVNHAMPRYVVEQLVEGLDRTSRIGLNGARVLIIGVSYKRNVDDTRESPALAIMELIEARGGTCDFHDPHVRTIPTTRRHDSFAGRQSRPLNADVLTGYDAVLVATDHDDIDYRLIAVASKLVIDTRNVFARRGIKDPRIFKA